MEPQLGFLRFSRVLSSDGNFPHLMPTNLIKPLLFFPETLEDLLIYIVYVLPKGKAEECFII